MNQVNVSINIDPYLSLRALSNYCSLSIRKIRDYLTAAINPLPHYRVGGKILVRKSEFDAWILRYRRIGNQDIVKIADELFKTVA